MRTGHVSERATTAPLTSVDAGSASPGLLPTPVARDGKGAGYRGQLPNVFTLLPTPRTSDTNGAGLHGDGGMDLRTAVSLLLPTPTAADSERTSTTYPRGNPTLTGAVSSSGDRTPRPSRAGKRRSAIRHPGQLSLDEAASSG